MASKCETLRLPACRRELHVLFISNDLHNTNTHIRTLIHSLLPRTPTVLYIYIISHVPAIPFDLGVPIVSNDAGAEAPES